MSGQLEFFLLTGHLTAVVVDFTDVDDLPDLQPISASVEFRPRVPAGQLVWSYGLVPPQGIALPPIKARFDTDGVLRTIQNSPVNEIQRVTVTGNPFTLAFNGSASTSNISSTATQAQVDTALEALPTVGAGNVSTVGPNGGPYDVTFSNALGNADQPLMTATNATVATTRPGTLAAGVKLTANTADIGLDILHYDVIFTNVVYAKGIQRIDSFAFESPTVGGQTIDLAEVSRLPPLPGL